MALSSSERAPQATTREHMDGRPLRILHCPETVGIYGYSLARAERRLGQESWSVAFQNSIYQFPTDEVLWQPADARLRKEFRRCRLLLRALLRFDVIHFNFGRTITGLPLFAEPGRPLTWKTRLRNWLGRLLDMQDLKLLKAAGKTIAVTFQGDDARQEALLRQAAPPELLRELPAGYYTPAADAYKRWRIAQMARYVDLVYTLNPDLLRILPPGTQFVPYPSVDPRDVVPSFPTTSEPPLVIHAPTHRGIKGTRVVLEVVRRLQDEGVPFRFQLVEGLSAADAWVLYRQADLLLDQFVLWGYGALAVELMALGKPVICRLNPSDIALMPAGLRAELPIIPATHLNLYDVLKEWLTVRRHELAEVGRRSRAFVEHWHDPEKIAAVMIEDYRQARANRRAA
jgi:glycosyltransferase involved in cell wall biosynthesis